MRTLYNAERQRARDLIQRLRDPKLPDDAIGGLLEDLEKVLLYPRVSDLLFWRAPEITADEVIDEALRYQPVVSYLVNHLKLTHARRQPSSGEPTGPATDLVG